MEFFNKVLSNCPNYIKEELIIYIKSDESRLVEFLTAYPSKITELKLESSFIRSFWSKQGKYIDDRHFPIILSMIRNKLILDIEIDEVKDVLLKKAAFYKMNIQAKELLENIGFFDLFKKEYVNGNAITDYEIGNRLSSLFIFYLDNYTIEKEIVQTIYNTLRQKNYPYDLCKDLTDFFKKKPDKKAEFIEYLSANEINSFSALIENNELF